MIIEKKRMETWNLRGESVGRIRLDKLAVPETVRVTLFGKTIIPKSFDDYGHPIFTEEQAMLYMFKEEELSRKNNGKFVRLEAEIMYEEKIFDVARSTFDTIGGIKKSLLCLSDLNEMLKNRRMFIMAHPKERLSHFIILGCFMLDSLGQVWSIEKKKIENLVLNADVEHYATFTQNNKRGFNYTSEGYDIPIAGLTCPCCGKLFTVDDIKNNPSVFKEGKYYHESCWKNYRRLTEVDKFTRCLMDIIYKDTDYQFELLPNGYCHDECCAHIPWFLFHTIDGDIVMGWRKRVISIEWQENYKSFDMNELFYSEEVTKWEENGKRGVHAWGKEKAYEYLKKVQQTVNPDYSK